MRFDLSQYETVETRLAKFWAQFPNGQVFTAIHHYDDNKVVFRAEIYKDISDPRPVATGYAEEVRDRLVGLMGGYIRWSGLVDDAPQAIILTERIGGRQLDPDSRELILRAHELR